jgi:anti-sigma factor ChrR (cupin superfamily)
VNIVLSMDRDPLRADSRLVVQIMQCLASALSPISLDRELCECLRRRVVAGVRAAGQPAGTHTVRADEGDWLAFAPGVTIKLLRVDAEADRVTALVQMQPGSSLPGHRHDQTEECLILKGELFIGRHRLVTGELHVAPAGTEHPEVCSPAGALMLVHAGRFALPDPDDQRALSATRY